MGMRDHLGNMGYGLMTGLGLFSGMTSGPFNAAISGAHQLSDMQNVAGMRNPGLRDSPSHGQQPGYDASIGTDNSGDMLVPTPLRIGEKGGLESGLLDSPLERAYQRDFGEVKKAALLAALKGGAQ